MPQHLKIDFVSDVACPWCVIGLKGLEAALERLQGDVTANIHFQPFELNPNMGSEGQNLRDHIAQKYGTTPEQSAASRAVLQERAAGVGFTIAMSDESRIYNTFDAHRLLHWAGEQSRQSELKHALFEAYFTQGANVSRHDVLLDVATRAGLDTARAAEILGGDEFAAAVRDDEELWRSRGISSVPAIIIDEKYLVSGGQPVEVFEEVLKKIAAERAAVAQ
ncbi:DsbA family oxidoreductase [Novosphingobium sp. P6W]|uniref:DsbA family oxidoreductase n=1 Tax=Novosphingobium sp. P6W TaxID=1609758 RepID=UPI0005C2C66D|nr:DsbA family oxidoreductase [Novosphingobium sp. P6W]AXB79630.1 DsbA family oxidoreductase [Novosphingobium sp. P6W]KIS34357.1 DSBA oxidoreductase [Novosphingobium sp. P6W]